ncbi:MAG TPA: aldehyde dehydrogenase family protein [Planctomycetota bacterium]|nr:aldehyde dehydrogenase family protein [Planctomycetota bacterium]
MPEKHLNRIDDRWSPPATGEWFENRNPANRGDLIGLFPKSDARDVDAAVAAAKRAYKTWRLVPAPRRAEILYRAGRILEERKEELARAMTREMGKVLAETRGDVQEAIDTAYYAAGEGRRLFGDTVPVELPDKFGMSVRCPVGVCALITPWNFPMAIPSWKTFPAIICGNTVVLKPASDTPLSSALFVKALEDAGLPPGVVNLVHGGGAAVGVPLAEHPDVSVVSFTGSTGVGKDLAERCGRRLKRLSLELGGKNGQIVMDDADLDLAVEGALWGAFGTTGQRCTATSRLIVHEKALSRFTEQLLARAKKLRLGDGLEPGTEVGPLVNEERRKAVHAYVKIGVAEGATLLCGGEPAEGGALDHGWFYAPTIFGNVDRSMRIAKEEIFGPVVAILRVGSLEEAIDVLNDTPYGLSSSIYTRDVNKAFRAVRDIEAGITYVNGPTIGAEVQLPFGGMKETGNGHREASHTVLDIFTEWKSVYVDYSGRLQKAQIDTHESPKEEGMRAPKERT